MVTFNIGLLYQEQKCRDLKEVSLQEKRKEIISIFLYKRNTDDIVIEISEECRFVKHMLHLK